MAEVEVTADGKSMPVTRSKATGSFRPMSCFAPATVGSPRQFGPWSRGLTTALALALGGLSACSTEPKSGDPQTREVLTADHFWPLNLPEGRRLDASGLMRLPDGAFVTVNDQDARVFRFEVSDTAEALDLTRVPDLLPDGEAAALMSGKRGRLDLEGVARDETGRWYLCEESQRWILRWDPESKKTERLEIDWGAVRLYFNESDPNASFEGIAVGGKRLYVANERQTGRIIVVDLATLRVVDHFTVKPAGSASPDTHFSDLCWAEGSLWALLRDVRKVLRIDPIAHAILAEYDYGEMENAPECGYGLLFAPGFMEGLWVDEKYIWLMVDNNGFARRGRTSDHRPILFRCRRPDRQ